MIKTKRQEQKELTRQKIIDAAFRIYARQGFAAPTSLIAKEAEVSHGSVFAHFPTSESLQIQVLAQFAEEVGGRLHNLSLKRGNITAILYGHIDVLAKYEVFYARLISELSALPDAAKTEIISLQSIVSRHFCIAIEQEEEGAIKEVPFYMLFNTWIALIHYYLQNRDLFAPGGSVLTLRRDELVNSFAELIVK